MGRGYSKKLELSMFCVSHGSGQILLLQGLQHPWCGTELEPQSGYLQTAGGECF